MLISIHYWKHIHYWKQVLCRVPETVGKDVEPVGKALPTAPLGTVLSENFFSAKDLCRAP
jgi:hypothetical protein